MDPEPDNKSGNHLNEVIQLHVVVQNLRSIQTQSRFEDSVVEVDDTDFDVFPQHGGYSTKILQNKWWTNS